MSLLNTAQADSLVILAPHCSSDQPAARSAVNQGSCHGWDKCSRPTAHYSLLYWMDEGSEHTARQLGVGSGEGRVGVKVCGYSDWRVMASHGR